MNWSTLFYLTFLEQNNKQSKTLQLNFNDKINEVNESWSFSYS